jgi:membrane glycosyltransferase
VFVTGIMTYVSAPLWLLSLKLSTLFILLQTLIGPQYFVEPRQLFPIWPEWDVHSAIGFAVGTAAALFVPKILAAVLVIVRGAGEYGGAARVVLSLVLEVLFSALLAPVRMLFHTQFVLAALTGWRIHWKSPPREDAETTWGEATRRHGLHTLLGAAWGAGMFWLAPTYAWWFLPVVGALTLSIPISVSSSRVSLGRALRRAKVFLIPEEARPPKELASVAVDAALTASTPRFVDAVVDPLTNAIACAASPPHARQARAADSRRELIAIALAKGPQGLTDAQKRLLLGDRVGLAELHQRVLTSPAAHPDWQAAAAARVVSDELEAVPAAS